MMLVWASPPLSSMPRQLNILTIMVLIRAHCSFCLHTKALSVFLIIIVKHHVSRANYTLQSSQLWSTVLHHVTLRLITKTNQSTKCRIPRAFDANGMVTRFKNYWFRISWRRGGGGGEGGCKDVHEVSRMLDERFGRNPSHEQDLFLRAPRFLFFSTDNYQKMKTDSIHILLWLLGLTYAFTSVQSKNF